MSAATADASARRCCCSVARRSYGRHSGTSTRRHGGRPTRTRPPRIGDAASMPAPTAKNETIAPDPRHMRSAMPPTRCASLAARERSAPGSTSTPPRRIEHAARDEALHQPPSAGVEQQRAPVTDHAHDRLRHRHHEEQRAHERHRADRAVVDDPVDRVAQHDRQDRDRAHPRDARQRAGDDPAALPADHPAHEGAGGDRSFRDLRRRGARPDPDSRIRVEIVLGWSSAWVTLSLGCAPDESVFYQTHR